MPTTRPASSGSLIPRENGVEYDVDHAVIGGQDRLRRPAQQGRRQLHPRRRRRWTCPVLDELETVIAAERHRPHQRHDRSTVDTMAVNLREGGLTQVRDLTRSATRIGGGHQHRRSTSRCSTSRPPAFGDWDQPFVRLSYGSWLTPDTVLDYDPRDQRAPRAQAEAGARRLRPGRLRPDPRMGDRARRRPDPDLDRAPQGRRSRAATSPLLLYGYGSYEISYDPFVSIARLSLLDRGMVFVLAHIRGGGEMGRRWYEHGKLLREEEHLHRLRRLRPAPDRHRLDRRRPTGRPRWQRRWAADGRGGQSRARPVRRPRGPGAVRRRPDERSSTRPAADGDRVGRVGRPAARPGGLRLHEVLHAVREHRSPGPTRRSTR